MNYHRNVRVYLLPAVVLQSVLFGGAYGTGREVVEFVSRHGVTGGYRALVLVTIVLALVLSLTFDYARRFRTHDYRSFFQHLLGPAWVAYEALFIVMLLLVLAVNMSAATMIMETVFLWHLAGDGIVFCLLLLGLLAAGQRVVELAMGVGFVLLLFTLLGFVLLVTGDPTAPQTLPEAPRALDGWVLSGLKFALYNAAAVPVLLYATTAISSRREALASGLIAAIAAVAPAVLLHGAFMGGGPAVMDSAFPVRAMLERGDHGSFLLVYAVVLLFMIVLTAVGLLQGLNARLRGWLDVRAPQMGGRWLRLLAPSLILLASLALAQAGLMALIARGYGTMAWGFLLVYLVPLLLRGVGRLRSGDTAQQPMAPLHDPVGGDTAGHRNGDAPGMGRD